MRSTILALCLAAGVARTARTQESLAGEWVGGTNVLGSWNFAQLRVHRANGALAGSFDIPSQEAMRLPLRAVAQQGSEVRFDIDTPLGVFTFNGTLASGIVDGTLHAPSGASGNLHLVPSATISRAAFDRAVGSYSMPDGRQLLVTYRPFGQLFVTQLSAGEPRTIQRTFNLVPLDSETFFTSGSVNAAPKRDERLRFAGDGVAQRIEWIVPNGGPLSAVRDAKSIRQEWVVIHNGPITLNATLFFPTGAAPYPALVSVGGSGPTTRDNVVVRSMELARSGLAVLVYDKRGTGDESGNWNSATYEQLASDASAAIRFLQSRTDIDPARVGLHGHSQGGWVAPIALASSPGVRFLVLSSPSALMPAEQEVYRAGRQVSDAGGSAQDAAAAAALMMLKWRAAIDTASWSAYDTLRRASSGAKWLGIVRPPETRDSPLWADLRAQLASDPRPAMRGIRVPTLLLFGADDAEVPPAESSVGWRTLLAAAGNADVRIEELPKVGHGVFIVTRGNATSVVPEAREILSRWLAAHGLTRP